MQKEIEVLRAKLVVLEAKDQQLKIEIQEQDRHIHEQDYELSTLLSWVSLKELQTIGKALADILVASHKIPYSLDFPEPVKRYLFYGLFFDKKSALFLCLLFFIVLYYI